MSPGRDDALTGWPRMTDSHWGRVAYPAPPVIAETRREGKLRIMGGKLFKLAAGGVILLVGLIVVAVVVFGSRIEGLIASAIEQTLEYVLQVEVTLDGVELHVRDGEVALLGLTIGNPEGFKTASALEFSEARVKVDLASFRTDSPTIHNILLSGPKITLEQGLRNSNLKQLIRNASRLVPEGGDEAEPEEEPEAPEGASKMIRVDLMTLENTTVAVSAPILRGKEFSYTLNNFELTNIGGEGNHLSVPKLLKAILTEILKQSVKGGEGTLPTELQAVLSTDIGGSLDGAKSQVRDALDTAAESLKEKAGEIGEKLGGLFKKD